MISTRKGRLSIRGVHSLIEDFDGDLNFVNAASDKQEIVEVNEGTVDWEFTASDTSSVLPANEKLVSLKTLEKCFKERIVWDMGICHDTVEKGIQNAFLTAIESNNAPINNFPKETLVFGRKIHFPKTTDQIRVE